VFDVFYNERLTEWKKFRDSLETSATPLEDTVKLWSRAPFVSSFLNPSDSLSWPGPWKLIIDNKFDRLAIILGMCYTLQLTARFMSSRFEIYKPIAEKDYEEEYYLRVDDHVLNLVYGEVLPFRDLDPNQTHIIWHSSVKK